NGARDDATAAEPNGVDLHGASTCAGANTITDQKCAAVNGGASGVGVHTAQRQRANTNLRYRAAHAAADSEVLHHPGKVSAQVVAAHGQVVGPEEDRASAFNGTNGHARGIVSADVQVALGN